MPGLAVAAVLGSGCLIHVDQVGDPARAFREAHGEAARAGRDGRPPHELVILAYDPGDEELVRVELPMWLVRRVCEDDGDFDSSIGDDGGRLARKLRHRWRWEELESAGAGVLLEAHDDGERVLIWLR
jgi:hypothetical protein